jgi:hypothetical protein
MYDALNAVIAESGIWSGSRRQSHAFLLSPSVYHITEEQKRALEELGHAIHDCLLGLSHIAVIAYDGSLNYGGTWLLARRIFSTGVPKIYQELQGMNVRHIPRLLKVDLMVDVDGNFRIAEIDGHNKHGVGYSTLARRFREALYPDAKALPGVVAVLAQEVLRLGFSQLKLLHSDQERFYVPEFEIAQQEFAKYGVECRVVSEMDIADGFLNEGLFMDLPFLYHRPELYSEIITAYHAGEVNFIIPPKPFLGAKGVLALLRNDTGDEQVESILRSFIKKRSIDLVRQYIPETLLVGRQAAGIDTVKTLVARKRYVLKESISSGMKGTVFSDSEDFEKILVKACVSNMNWILQEEVANQPQSFSWFECRDGETPRIRMEEDWFMRVTVQYVGRSLADVVVTACRDKAVHGGKNCLQIGSVIS